MLKLTAEQLRRSLIVSGHVVPETMDKFQKELMATVQSDRDSKPPIVFVNNLNAGSDTLAISFYDVAACINANATTVASGNLDLAGMVVWLTGTTRIATPNVSFNFDELGHSVNATTYFSYTDLKREISLMGSTMVRYAVIISQASNGMISESAVLKMMNKHTSLSALGALKLGLATAIAETDQT